MTAGVPLAWLNLTKDPRRLLAALTGIAFAVMLMLVELGFQTALYASASMIYTHLEAEVAAISPLYQSVNSPGGFDEIRLYQALGDEAVASADALYIGGALWKNPVTREKRPIFAIGFKPRRGIMDLPAIDANAHRLQGPDAVLFDAKSRPEFGPVAELFRRDGRVRTEVSEQRVEVAGLFELGATFAADGNLIVGDSNFFRLAPGHRRDRVDIGLLRLKPGADVAATVARLNAALPDDVEVLTRQDLVRRELDFWASSTPIGFVFGLGLAMGLIVGSVIVYQILYADVAEHLGEYATLKAIGYPDRALFRVVLEEALILSLLGFVPGLLLSYAIYEIARDATLLPMDMEWRRVAAVYLLTAVMCAASGALAMRKLKTVDPAEIF